MYRASLHLVLALVVAAPPVMDRDCCCTRAAQASERESCCAAKRPAAAPLPDACPMCAAQAEKERATRKLTQVTKRDCRCQHAETANATSPARRTWRQTFAQPLWQMPASLAWPPSAQARRQRDSLARHRTRKHSRQILFCSWLA